MYGLLKVFLFRLDPEKAHQFTMWCMLALMKIPGIKHLFRALYGYSDPALKRKVAGLEFANPVGLAAGFDKNGLYLEAMSLLGFSHIEVGTITPRPQSGNPKPRLFRLVRSKALINRMGFNNDGVEVLARRLREHRPPNMIIGANIGKNKDTPNEKAVEDYLFCFKALYGLADYFTVNVSSPNTPGLRALQDKEPLTQLLTTLQTHNHQAKPVFLKIAPDLTLPQLDEIVAIVQDTGIAGVIATNTTITREHVQEDAARIAEIGAGGLSGAPLLNMSTGVVRYLREKAGGRFSIIGVGGIEDASGAKSHLDAGADLIQIYTGLIYTGPGLVRRILKGLLGK